MLVCLSACGHYRYVYVDRVIRDSTEIVNNRIDTLICVDSVFVDRYRSGDTVFIDKEKIKYVYRYSGKTDSVYIAVHDTAEKPVEVIPDGYIKPSGWDKFMLGWGNWFFWFTIGVLLAVAIRLVIKIYFRK